MNNKKRALVMLKSLYGFDLYDGSEDALVQGVAEELDEVWLEGFEAGRRRRLAGGKS